MVVHRLLSASLGLCPLPPGARDREGLKALTDNLNVRHRNAQMAGRASVELHTLIFFKNRTVVADARVTAVRIPPIGDCLSFWVEVVCVFSGAVVGNVHWWPSHLMAVWGATR